jgi:Fic family protein
VVSAQFSAAAPGKLVHNLEGRLAFVPDPLPPALVASWKLATVVDEATRALARLDGLARALPDPELLIRTFVRREAVLTSYIENTYADVDEVGRFEHDPSVATEGSDHAEVYNAELAIRHGLAALRDGRRLSLGLIREMHALLLRGVRGHDADRGRFRERQVYIGDASLGIDAARFVPPPPLIVPELMEQLGGYLLGRDDLPVVVRAALVHYQFECVHPFLDGNGRIGRAWILLQLCAEGALQTPVLNPSLYFESFRREYYDGLSGVSERGDWGPWIRLFANGMRESADDATARVRRLVELRAEYHERARSARGGVQTLRVIDELFVSPRVSLNQVADTLKIGFTSAKKQVLKLLSLHILRETTGKKRNREFLADEIYELLKVTPTRR